MHHWNQKTTTTSKRASIFSDHKETFLNYGIHDFTPSGKAAPEQGKKNRSEPSLSRKALDFQDQYNDVNNSVKIQYNKLS